MHFAVTLAVLKGNENIIRDITEATLYGVRYTKVLL